MALTQLTDEGFDILQVQLSHLGATGDPTT